MAERIEVELVDDIDGSPAQHTVTFALDGVTYEIDLGQRHAQQLRSLLGGYIERARSPEKPPQTSKQQEREEQQNRQTNRQFTEQIRGAAQRSREQQKAQEKSSQAPAEPAQAPDEDGLSRVPVESGGDSADRAEQPAKASEYKETKDDKAPSVSLPQFSSAVD